MRSVVSIVAGTFIALFAGVWIWIGWMLIRFDPNDEVRVLVLSDPLLITAGFLASTVGAGTAAVLGITVAEVKPTNPPGTSLADSVNAKVRANPLLLAGVLIYFFVGVFILIMWLARSDQAPDIFKTFAIGILGWAGGAFSSVFKAKSAA